MKEKTNKYAYQIQASLICFIPRDLFRDKRRHTAASSGLQQHIILPFFGDMIDYYATATSLYRNQNRWKVSLYVYYCYTYLENRLYLKGEMMIFYVTTESESATNYNAMIRETFFTYFFVCYSIYY